MIIADLNYLEEISDRSGETLEIVGEGKGKIKQNWKSVLSYLTQINYSSITQIAIAIGTNAIAQNIAVVSQTNVNS